ncbi:hypothetical protein [Capillimicrobium parvum]|uniref:Spheroidene monooxygenase n=1 Tax=Capillimicrobium parvum TaxID=2884022 RepID=A0A9E7C0A7_9ACTN|nr:hypothetical protein [Capillimicrobium parvum]UGS35429.1 hypothetical protein DSM104329_01817 [Capillimicrobium parvum]
MLLTVHLVPAGAPQALRRLRRRPAPRDGLIWSETTLIAPLPAGGPPRVDGNGLIAAWRDGEALDAFLADDPLAGWLATGWSVRLEPLRAYGGLPELPGLGRPEREADPREPVAVLTFGRTKLHRLVPFLRASAAAERQARRDPAVLLSTAITRPPRTVATFSVWRTAEEMRAYATQAGAAHAEAMRRNAERPFHRDQLFARFRPSAVEGSFHRSAARLQESTAA